MDPLRIIETAYRLAPGEARWIDRVAREIAPFAPAGGVVGCTIDCRAGAVVEEIAIEGGATDEDADGIRRFCKDLPPALTSKVFAPTEFVGYAGRRLQRIAADSGLAVERLATNETRLPPMWAVIGGDPRGRCILVAFPDRHPGARTDPFSRKESEVFGLVGAHLGAALRLQRLATPAAEEAETQAILGADGAILHAVGEATDRRMRASLSEAVLRSERARGRLRRVDPTEATRLWAAMTEGRWSIVEAEESDGRRLLIARKNSLSRPDVLELTKEENDVVWLVVHGHTNKFIAYELGISISRVARLLASSLKKLRIHSRRELLRRLGSPATRKK